MQLNNLSINAPENKSENPVNNAELNPESQNAGIESENSIYHLTASINAKARLAAASSQPTSALKLKDFKWVPVLFIAYYWIYFLLLAPFLLDYVSFALVETQWKMYIPGVIFFFVLIVAGFLLLFRFREGTSFKQLCFLIFISLAMLIFIIAVVLSLVELLFDSSLLAGIMAWPLINLSLFGALLLIRADKVIASNPAFLFLFSHLLLLSTVWCLFSLALFGFALVDGR